MMDPKKTVPITATAEELEKITRMFETWHHMIHENQNELRRKRIKSQAKYLIGSLPGGVFVWIFENLVS